MTSIAKDAMKNGADHHRSGKNLRITTNYIRERLEPPSKFDRGSFRTVESGEHRVVVACPKNQYKRGKCLVALQAQSILHPISEKRHLCKDGNCVRE